MIIAYFYISIMFIILAYSVWLCVAANIRHRHIPILLAGGYEYWQLYRIYRRLKQHRAMYGRRRAKRWLKYILDDCKTQL